MKITKEWLENEIALCDKNLKFYDEKTEQEPEGSWDYLMSRECGIKEGLERVLFHKAMSNRSCALFDKKVPQWKRNIIRFLRHICDWLEGVEDVRLFERDSLEKRNDEARKRYRNKK